MTYIVERSRRFCAFITGFVFFISGILKVLDPVGAGLVMGEYLEFLHIGFLGFASKALGTAFALAETLLGAALITGVWRRLTACMALGLQGFFTLLTLALLIVNPEMDCGCFGEAIHLTHAQTFVKNIILCILLAVGFIPIRNIGEPVRRKYVSFSIVAVSVTVFCIYSYLYIPLVDFTEFRQTAQLKAGNDLQDEGQDRFEAVFTYEKDGKQQTFDLLHLPDSSWTYVSTETRLKEEFQDEGASLSFYDASGEYQDKLAAIGNTMVISVYDPDIRQSRWEDIAGFIRIARETECTPLLLIGSTPENISAIMQTIGKDTADELESCIYFADRKTLMTLNRSNGGAVWFSDGYLIRKWARRALPDKGQLLGSLASDATEAIIEKSTRGSLALQGFLLYVFAVMLLL